MDITRAGLDSAAALRQEENMGGLLYSCNINKYSTEILWNTGVVFVNEILQRFFA